MFSSGVTSVITITFLISGFDTSLSYTKLAKDIIQQVIDANLTGDGAYVVQCIANIHSYKVACYSWLDIGYRLLKTIFGTR